MICPNCNHVNQGGKFCESCGTNLTNGAASQTAASFETNAIPASNQYTGNQYNQTQASQGAPNQYIETTKEISKQYTSYFLQVLKKPFASTKSVGSEHFINGIITMVLYALMIPLMFYFALKGIVPNYIKEFLNTEEYGIEFVTTFIDGFTQEIAFTDVVVKPFFTYLIFILLVTAFTFGALKLGRVQVSFKEVAARFGSFLIPFVTILLASLLLSIIKVDFAFYVLLIGFIGSIFMVPALVIGSYRRESNEGLDVIYGALLTYILTLILLRIMGGMMFENLLDTFKEMMQFQMEDFFGDF